MIPIEQLQLIANDPQAWLLRNDKINERIQAKKNRISRLHAVCTATTQAIKPVVVYTGPSNKIEKCVTEIIDLENEIASEIQELLQIQRQTEEVILSFLNEAKYITIMEMRYLSGYKMEEISNSLNYSLRWVQRLHAEALSQMKENALLKLKC